ncbi:calcium-binding protein [Swingsia samuiensis]|uniref:Calcium-binding protein n=1 Tax=Swingsia samuiensis TaxID=1293412 RepID=A0A4Y6UKG0_9PROT|nr:calcium-binding protein [Swingsia samuiensis]QDH16956.1 calcium-binding protein [Swingsia samuiensis]
MAVTTVVGASGHILAVTVDGAQAEALAKQYSSAVTAAKSRLTSYDLVPGSNNSISSPTGVAQGIITQGGSYNINGDVAYIAAGSYGPLDSPYGPKRGNVNPQDTLRGAATINTSGDTAKSINILAGDWDGVTVNIANNQNGKFVGGVGDNVFNGKGLTGSWNIATGSGNDTINGTNGNNTIAGGTGNNAIYLGQGRNIVLSEGQDTVTGVAGSRDTVTLLGGSSLVNIRENATVFDAADHNQVTVGTNSFITGGSSSNYSINGGTGTVFGGQSDTISAAGDMQQVRGDSNNLSVAGSLQFLNGTGNTAITAGQATMFGASGLHLTFDATNTDGQENLFVGNDGDEYISAASSHGTLHAFAGTGDTTIIGGTASDTLVGGTGKSTLQGGSGDSNLFAITKGHAGSEYTIQDFGSAAGNLMALYQYGLQNNGGLQNVLSHATVAGGNSTIALDDGSKITFVGVTQLSTKNFTLS